MKVALVHDWCTGMRGGEKCLEVLCEIFPGAPIYTLLHNPRTMSPLIESKHFVTSFIDRLPAKSKQYRKYLPLFPLAAELFDLSDFDLVVSTSHAVAKNVRVRKGALHICYCHTPMRYVWEMYEEYFGKGKAGLATRMAMKVLRPLLQWWDVRTSDRVHYYIANSENVRQRILRYYRRDAEVIFPPVDTERFQLSSKNEGFHLIVSALVPYKRVDLAVEVFNRTGQDLVIAGTGPESDRLKGMAKRNITFLGWQSDEQLAELYSRCSALIFPGVEDFGIVPLEAQASGKPVIAFGRGGALETVVDGVTGVFFGRQDADSLEEAIQKAAGTNFEPARIRDHALSFSRSNYRKNMEDSIAAKVRQHLLQ